MVKYEPPFNNIAGIPPPVLSNEDYSGPFNFEVSIQSSNTGSKNQWIFSEKLKKIFVMMSTAFPVDFKWNHYHGKRMFVRATPLFSQPQHSQEMVVRCAQHSQPLEQSNISLHSSIIKHVLRCQNSNATYEGDADNNQHFSVVVPLGVPQSGVDYVRQMYNFVCKNSCPGIGMNRRLIDVVFTLEDDQCQIWGRKAFSVRICSCPKRDKDKEEREVDAKEAKGRMNGPEQTVPQGKKRKLEKKTATSETATSDKAVIDLNLKVVGKNNAYNVLKYAYDLLAGDVVRSGQDHPHKAVMQSLCTQMREYE